MVKASYHFMSKRDVVERSGSNLDYLIEYIEAMKKYSITRSDYRQLL